MLNYSAAEPAQITVQPSTYFDQIEVQQAKSAWNTKWPNGYLQSWDLSTFSGQRFWLRLFGLRQTRTISNPLLRQWHYWRGTWNGPSKKIDDFAEMNMKCFLMALSRKITVQKLTFQTTIFFFIYTIILYHSFIEFKFNSQITVTHYIN